MACSRVPSSLPVGRKERASLLLPLPQALMLSSLRDDLLPFLNPALEEQRSVNCLTPVLKWFRTQYVLFDNNEAEIRDQDRLSIHSQVSPWKVPAYVP